MHSTQPRIHRPNRFMYSRLLNVDRFLNYIKTGVIYSLVEMVYSGGWVIRRRSEGGNALRTVWF